MRKTSRYIEYGGVPEFFLRHALAVNESMN